MKHFLLITIVATVLCAFAKQNNNHFTVTANNSIAPDDTTIAGTWVLQPVLSSDTAAGRIPKLNFNLVTRKFTGNTGCNDMRGNFLISGDSLSFNEQIVTTRKVCEGYNETAFIDNLTKTNHYKIVDGVLQLMHDQTILSKWTRKLDTTGSNKA